MRRKQKAPGELIFPGADVFNISSDLAAISNRREAGAFASGLVSSGHPHAAAATSNPACKHTCRRAKPIPRLSKRDEAKDGWGGNVRYVRTRAGG